MLSELPALESYYGVTRAFISNTNCMLTGDRTMILEGLANCQENTPVTLVLRVKKTNEVGDFRANY